MTERFYVRGHKDHPLLVEFKKKFKGRYYKRLHGDKDGWSFPACYQEEIERLIGSTSSPPPQTLITERPPSAELEQPPSVSVSLCDSSTSFSPPASLHSVVSSAHSIKNTHKYSTYEYDIEPSVKLFFESFLQTAT